MNDSSSTTSGMRSAVILGAGVAGLAAGWRLARTGRWRVTVIERGPFSGGLCRTFRHGDALLDHGPHKCFSTIPGVLDELRALMGSELLSHEKKNSLYLFGRYLQYPLRIGELLTSMSRQDLVACMATALRDRIHSLGGDDGPDSYERYIVSRFGRRLYELIFEPLAEKVWGDPATLSADLARTRLPSTSILDLVARMLKLKPETALTNAETFYYPRRGFGRIPERMAEEIIAHGGNVWTSTTPTAIHHTGGRIDAVTVQRSSADRSGLDRGGADGSGQAQRLPCDLLISTIPFDGLGELLQQGQSDPRLDDLIHAARRLQYRHLILTYVVADAEDLTRDHWIFFPDRSVVFGRIFEQKRLSRTMVPAGQTVICCDMVDGDEGARWRATDAELGQRCVDDLRRLGILGGAKVRETFVKRTPRFYPRYDLAYRQTLTDLYAEITRFSNLIPTGRIGFYNYNNSDHCVDMAMQIEDGLRVGAEPPEIVRRLEARVAGYRIVD